MATKELIIQTAHSLVNHDKHPDRCDIMDWYKGFSTAINRVACCCAGMMYLFDNANALSLIPGGKVADCGSLCTNFYKAGQLYGPDKVQPGDLVIFSWSKERSTYWPASALGYKTLDHVELCVAVYDDTIKCIGANNGGYECDDFQIKTRYKSNISCCCRPKYDSGGSSSESTVFPQGGTGCPVSLGYLAASGYANATAQVKTLQRLLAALGYKGKDGKALSIDGVFGGNTTYAVKAYQTASKLTADGIVGSATWKAMLGAGYATSVNNTAKVSLGYLAASGYANATAQVKTLQRLLAALGHKGKDGKALSVDGVFGGNTTYAVKSYQTANKLAVDGVVGSLTWKALLGGN